MDIKQIKEIIKFGENLVSKTEEEYKKIRDYYGNVRSGEDLELTIVREGKVELLRAKKP